MNHANACSLVEFDRGLCHRTIRSPKHRLPLQLTTRATIAIVSPGTHPLSFAVPISVSRRARHTSAIGNSLFAVAVILVASTLTVVVGYTDALVITLALLIAPIITLIDGAPAYCAIGFYPLSGLLSQHSVGVGGYKIVAVFCGACWIAGRIAGWQSFTLRLGMIDAAVACLMAVALANILILSDAGKLGTIQWYAGNLLLYLFFRGAISTASRLTAAMVAFCAGAVTAALFGFVLYGQGLVPTEEGLHGSSSRAATPTSWAQ